MYLRCKVKKNIDENKLISPSDTVIVAVSGGADSVALLHILSSLGYNCTIAHCNFHLRGKESDRDELFVKGLAVKLNCKYYVRHFNTTAYAKKNGISIEMAARDLRYCWFYELADKLQAQVIAVAHHADDNIETLFMNLIRGTGFLGITGIPNRNGKVVRPLLPISRAEIESYLAENSLDYVTDSTNFQNDYQRNKIRNEVLPLLEKINPSARKNMYESLSYLNETYNIYKDAIHLITDKVSIQEKDFIKIDIKKLKKEKYIRAILFEILHPMGFSSATIKLITSNLDGLSGKKFYSDDYCLLRNRDEFILSKRTKKNNKIYFIQENDKQLNEPLYINLKKIKNSPDFKIIPSKNRIYMDHSKLQFPLKIRRWKEGDAFQPFGMKGNKKVSDFFIDQKLSGLEKQQCWLLFSDDKIVWIIGHRADDRFRIDLDTKEILEMEIPEN